MHKYVFCVKGSIWLTTIFFAIGMCQNVYAATVVTNSVTNVTGYSAKISATVTNDDGLGVDRVIEVRKNNEVYNDDIVSANQPDTVPSEITSIRGLIMRDPQTGQLIKLVYNNDVTWPFYSMYYWDVAWARDSAFGGVLLNSVVVGDMLIGFSRINTGIWAVYNGGLYRYSGGWQSYNGVYPNIHPAGSSAGGSVGSGGVGAYDVYLSNLIPGTVYHARSMVIEQDGDRIYGDEIVFSTPLANNVAPIINSQKITNITQTFSTGNADIINTNNQDSTRTIEWGIQSGNYTSSCIAGSLNSDGLYSCDLTNLTADTTYYVRIKAMNSIGTTYGDEIAFTTFANNEGASNKNINLTISENLTLNCGSSVDLDNGTTLTAGTPQTNTTTCQVTTNDQEGYNLSLTDDRSTNNALYHITNSSTQDGQIQDKTPWNSTTPNAQAWNGTGLGFGLLSSTATKNTSWWGNANNCNDTTQLYAGLPDTDTNIMEHTTYSNTHTDTVICYKLDIPSTQLSGEYEGSVTYTAAGRP